MSLIENCFYNIPVKYGKELIKKKKSSHSLNSDMSSKAINGRCLGGEELR